MTLLARRGAPGDFDEAMELGRRHAHLDGLMEGYYTVAGLAWLALKTGRAAAAARLAGRLGRIAMSPGDPRGSRNARTVFNSLRAALQAEMTEAELVRLMADGATLSAEDARRLVIVDDRAPSRLS
jgi:hypothetical protein